MVDDSEFFREMTLRICSSLDIDHALAQAFEYLKQHIPVDALGLGFNDLPHARIRVVAKVAEPGARYPWADGAEAIELSGELVDYIRTMPTDRPTTRVVGRPEHAPELVPAFPGLASHSVIFLRLEVRDEVVGALLASVRGHDRYTPEHARRLATIREPFAVAMINARHYRELAALKDRLAEDNRALSADIRRVRGQDVVGAEFGLRGVMEQVRKVAQWNSPTLLLGETGTGKEVIAHAIHQASRRSRGPMVSMQCGAIAETLLDSELFGHDKGAFTGAAELKRGRFERAHGGTLFLDEIGELSLDAQVKLLRVLQERRFERVGGSKTLEVDVRVIAATHRDLEAMVREGTFREDLWYRLNVLPIRIPPLRLRREDIPTLVQYFVERKSQEMNLARVPRVPSRVLARLGRYDWPGNVRELQNVVERALILSRGQNLEFPALASSRPAAAGARPPAADEPALTMDEAIAAHIRSVLERVRWKVSGPGGAAEVLQMNPSTLRFRMKKLGIDRTTG